MTDPITITEFVGILVAALGGKEGIRYIVRKRNGAKNNFVTKEFCGERHSHLEKLLDEVRADVKKILSNTRST